MTIEHVSHRDIAAFAQNKVNLPRDKANEYRAQARRLRERLESYLSENPDFSLRRMQISGSLAKGTALRTINDIDVACYVSGSSAPSDVAALLEYMAQRLRSAFPNFSPDQVQPQTYCVKVSFRGTGLDVDVVPILYNGDPDWYGDLVSQEDGSLLRTNIPRHIEFIKTRKDRSPEHFAQMVRLIKFWCAKTKREVDGFRFKSFMIELILAKLADDGLDLSDYPTALEAFFSYVANSDLADRIVFSDFYDPKLVGPLNDPVQIIDPVNHGNNAARLYSREQADMVVDACLDTGDAIAAALYATSKQDTLYYWRKVFGPSFNV